MCIEVDLVTLQAHKKEYEKFNGRYVEVFDKSHILHELQHGLGLMSSVVLMSPSWSTRCNNMIEVIDKVKESRLFTLEHFDGESYYGNDENIWYIEE